MVQEEEEVKRSREEEEAKRGREEEGKMRVEEAEPVRREEQEEGKEGPESEVDKFFRRMFEKDRALEQNLIASSAVTAAKRGVNGVLNGDVVMVPVRRTPAKMRKLREI